MSVKRTAFIAISALVHLLFLYWFVHLRFPIRIAATPPIVREVAIATPEMILPAGLFSMHPRLIPDKTIMAVRGGTAKARGKAGSGPAWSPFVPRATSILGLPSSKPGALTLPMAPKESSKKYDLGRYVRPEYYGWGPLAGRQASGVGELPRPGNVILETRGDFYSPDLFTWARLVVKLIDQNWIIPTELAIRSQCRVVIALTVNRQGEVMETVVSIPSSLQVFNEAALNAVRLSRRMPPLPKSFPDDIVKTQLVFQYGS